MTFTQDKHVPVEKGETIVLQKGVVKEADLKFNPGNPFKETDTGIIIQAFEIEAANWDREDYTRAYHYRDVYSTRHFSERVRDQMNYYPGMHQTTSGVPATDPQYTEAKKLADDRLGFWNSAMDSPDSFMNGLRQRQEDFDWSKIYGPDTSAEERARNIGKMMLECIPCFDRLLDGAQLLPDGDLLEVHALNIKIRTDLLDKIRELFKDPGMYIDICKLLKLLSHLCPQDLFAMLALLTQYLAKLNLDVKFNINFIIQLIGPILSPFLDALSGWLDKWMQLILGPILCVIDHINETIMLSQSMEIPFSNMDVNVDGDVNFALPAHRNMAGSTDSGAKTGSGAQARPTDAWSNWTWEQFETPEKEKYNPTVPEYPTEETQLAKAEMTEAWSPSFSEAEREERTKRWQELRMREIKKRRDPPPPLRPDSRDGTRWSKDDIPDSEKDVAVKGGFDTRHNPPERQTRPQAPIRYFDASPLINSIVQLRNIMQGAIQYVKDWFTYITQMIYDLLGTEIGWMSKKADTTVLKSRIIQLILMIKAIIQAIKQNGLECGINSNFNPAQLRYITEVELNRNSSYQFKVLDDGSISLLSPGRSAGATVEDLNAAIGQIPKAPETSRDDGISAGTTPDQVVSETKLSSDEQKFVESGIIIKDCLKDVSKDEIAKVRSWIADFEKRGGANA